MNLMPVITWLENGCDPKEAAKELRIYQSKIECLMSEQRDAGKRAALEKLRQQTAKVAEHYRGDARRFALAGQYGTAREMAGNAEAHGLLCMEIGRELGLADGDALATPNVE